MVTISQLIQSHQVQNISVIIEILKKVLVKKKKGGGGGGGGGGGWWGEKNNQIGKKINMGMI